MPFTQVPEMPSQPPTVRIFLTGQLMLQPDAASKSCEVFVNRSAPNHQLTVEVREKRPGQPDAILMRHHGPLEFRETNSVDGLLIKHIAFSEAAGELVPAGNMGMYTGAATPFGEALSLAIDLRGEGFHPSNEMRIDFDSARPSILIQDGIFHTAFKISPEKVKVKLARGTEKRDLEPFASLIGANVYLNKDEFLVMNWRDLGLSKTLSLTKPKEDGTTYEIYIINDPLFEDEEEPKAHDELAEYYKVLPSVATEDRFKMQVEFVQPVASDKGTSKSPCMPVVVSGP
jgi:hypothetical protein